MLYVKLDVNFQDDDKLVEVSAEAELLYVRSLAIAKRLLSDGRIARGQLRRLADKLVDPLAGGEEDLAKELVAADLWSETERGWLIVAWPKHNATADDIEAKRAGGRRGNHVKWEHPGPFETCDRCNRSHSDSHSDRTSDSLRRPLETETETETKDPPKSPPAKRRAKTLPPPEWEPNTAHRDLAAKHGVDLDTEAQRFRDYCVANDKRYADHNAAFRNWITNDQYRANGSRNGQLVRLTATEQRTQRNRQNIERALAEQREWGLS